jgi:anhydro-N-acetylmuramic acid kinase
MTALRSRLNCEVETAETVGWSSEYMEAEDFGFLAVRTRRNLPLTFPETTGAARSTCGGIAVSASGPAADRLAVN